MKLWNKLKDLLFPMADRCPICGSECEACACRAELRALRTDHPDHAFHYDGIVREMILQLKFGGKAVLAEPMADLIGELLNPQGSCITHVPLHPLRRRERGYDQSALIAKRLSALTGIPFRSLLIKNRNTPPQSAITDRESRFQNIHGAFLLKDPALSLAGERILLIDDVLTTGATAGECRKLLEAAGAEVRTVTFAKGGKEWQPQEPCSQEP